MKCYRGYRDEGDRAVVEVFEHRRRGRGVPLVHHRKHSPAGFEWGYLGSGPAELARCLLIDHLGPSAWCPTCQGTGIMAPAHVHGGTLDPDQCWVCLGEATTFGPQAYQSLKHEHVSTWGEAWELTAADLRLFLRRFADYPAVARSLARAGGLPRPGVTVLGPRLDSGGRTP